MQEWVEEGGAGAGRLRAVGRVQHVLQRLTNKEGKASAEQAPAAPGGAVGSVADWWTVPLPAEAVTMLEGAVAVGEGGGVAREQVVCGVAYEARGCWWQSQVSAVAAGLVAEGDEDDGAMGLGVGGARVGERRVRVRLPAERKVLGSVEVQLLLTRTQGEKQRRQARQQVLGCVAISDAMGVATGVAMA